jgi:hypothetical protein
MPNLIPYFIIAFKDYKYKNKLYIIITKIKKTENKEDNIILIK